MTIPCSFHDSLRDTGPTDGNSTGLGLAIVEWIVRVHRGSIAVESQPGQGSCLTVTLPLAPPSHAKTAMKGDSHA